MSWLLTHSGRQFDLIDPQPDMIDLVDIVKGLSREARFAGQSRYYYTVAQHSVMASRIVPPEFAFEALLHDASEAYIKDIPRPLKQLLPDYRAVEAKVDSAVRERFGLPARQSGAVSHADRVMLATERRDLMPADANDWPILNGIRPLDRRLTAVNCRSAEMMFMQRLLEVIQQ